MTAAPADQRVGEARELRDLAADTALAAHDFVTSLQEMAAGATPEVAIPVVLLAVSQLLPTGARLGARTDVVPSERFEPDAGPDADVDPLRISLANLFHGLDEYLDVAEPLTDGTIVRGSLSDDLADIASDLSHGLRHYRAGRVDEALWWWQYSYVATWGLRATSALRVLQAILASLRLAVDDETVSAAQFDALHAEDAELPA